MATIDKTYLSDYYVYRQFIAWARETVYICPNGLKMRVSDYIYSHWTKENMEECERPVLNSPYSLDYFLIKNCPFKFVQDRLKEVYDRKYYESVLNGTSLYDTFVYPEIGTHFTILRGKNMKHKNYLWKLRDKTIYFFIEAEYNHRPLWYSDKLHRFIMPYELGEGNSSCAYKTRTIKSLLRHLRKMKLPKGAIVTAEGRFVGESLLILVR